MDSKNVETTMIMEPQFDVISAMKDRHSVRTYEPRQVDKADLDLIAAYIKTLDNPFSIKDITINLIGRGTSEQPEKLGTYGMIKGASTFLTLATRPDPAAVTMAGYEFERLVLYITSLGLGTVWLGGTFKRKQFAATADLNAGLIMPAVSPVGYPATRRLTERIARKMFKADQRKPWASLFFDGDLSTPLTPESAGAYATPLEMVRIAPSATNTQPWRVIRRGADFRFYGAFKPVDGQLETTMRYLDMGIALCHFDLSLTQLGVAHRITAEPDAPTPDGLTYIATVTV